MSNLPEWLQGRRVVAEPCRRCDRPIEVISPGWVGMVFDTDGSARVTRYAPDDSALCVRCALETNPDNRAEWEAHLLPKLQRRRMCHVPDGLTVFHQQTQERRPYKHTQAVYVEEFSFLWLAEEPLGHGDLPLWAVATPQGVNFLLLLSLDIFMEGAPVAARLTWNMARPDLRPPLVLTDWQRASHTDALRLMTVFEVFYKRAAHRPRGSTVRTPDEYEAAFRAVTAHLGRKPRSLEEFSRLSEIPVKTTKRNLKQWGKTWRQFKQEQPGP